MSSQYLLEAINWVVNRAIEGVGPMKSADELAKEYLKKYGDSEKAISALLRNESWIGAGYGFVMGIPGIVLLPLILPINIGTEMFLSARLVSTIAALRGWDLHSPNVKAFVELCLLGNQGKELLKGVTTGFGSKVAQKILLGAAARASAEIRRRAGASLVLRVTQRGALGLGRAMPILGGVLGLVIDGSYVYLCGKAAMQLFPAVTGSTQKSHLNNY